MVIGGVLIDGGNSIGAHPAPESLTLNRTAGFHGMTMSENPPSPFRLARTPRGSTATSGAAMAPMTAFQPFAGVWKHCGYSAPHRQHRKIVAFLSQYRAVASVTQFRNFLRIPDHCRLRKRLLPHGAGAVRPDLKVKAAGKVFIRKTRLVLALATSAMKSLVIHPASTTHRMDTAAALESGGNWRGNDPVSIGIEGRWI